MRWTPPTWWLKLSFPNAQPQIRSSTPVTFSLGTRHLKLGSFRRGEGESEEGPASWVPAHHIFDPDPSRSQILFDPATIVTLTSLLGTALNFTKHITENSTIQKTLQHFRKQQHYRKHNYCTIQEHDISDNSCFYLGLGHTTRNRRERMDGRPKHFCAL